MDSCLWVILDFSPSLHFMKFYFSICLIRKIALCENILDFGAEKGQELIVETKKVTRFSQHSLLNFAFQSTVRRKHNQFYYGLWRLP